MKKTTFLSGMLFFVVSLAIYAQDGDLFIVKKDITKNISGDVTDISMKIYDIITDIPYSNTVITIGHRFSDNFSVNYIDFYFYGKDWQFYNTILIKLDDSLYRLETKNSDRSVARSGSISEYIISELTSDVIEKLKSCKTIIIQANGKYTGEPITIDPAGISSINKFFSTTE
jgi:hypothetical protein